MESNPFSLTNAIKRPEAPAAARGGSQPFPARKTQRESPGKCPLHRVADMSTYVPFTCTRVK